MRVEYSDYGFGRLHTFSLVEVAAAEGTSGHPRERAEEISRILRAWLLRAVDHHAGVGPDWPGGPYPESGPQPQFAPPTVRPPTAGSAEVARTVERFAEDLRHSEATSTEPPAGWGLDGVATASCDAVRVRNGDPDWLVTEWRVRLHAAGGIVSVWGTPTDDGRFSDIRVGFSGDGERTAVHEYSPYDVAALGGSGEMSRVDCAAEIGDTLRAWLTQAVEHHAGVDLRWPAPVAPAKPNGLAW